MLTEKLTGIGSGTESLTNLRAAIGKLIADNEQEYLDKIKIMMNK